MSLFNLGGPGWFSDVFTVELELSSERVIETHSMLFHEKCKVSQTHILKTNLTRMNSCFLPKKICLGR